MTKYLVNYAWHRQGMAFSDRTGEAREVMWTEYHTACVEARNAAEAIELQADLCHAAERDVTMQSASPAIKRVV